MAKNFTLLRQFIFHVHGISLPLYSLSLSLSLAPSWKFAFFSTSHVAIAIYSGHLFLFIPLLSVARVHSKEKRKWKCCSFLLLHSIFMWNAFCRFVPKCCTKHSSPVSMREWKKSNDVQFSGDISESKCTTIAVIFFFLWNRHKMSFVRTCLLFSMNQQPNKLSE